MSFRIIYLPHFTTEARIHSHPSPFLECIQILFSAPVICMPLVVGLCVIRNIYMRHLPYNFTMYLQCQQWVVGSGDGAV